VFVPGKPFQTSVLFASNAPDLTLDSGEKVCQGQTF
jgi:hypothetical protein